MQTPALVPPPGYSRRPARYATSAAVREEEQRIRPQMVRGSVCHGHVDRERRTIDARQHIRSGQLPWSKGRDASARRSAVAATKPRVRGGDIARYLERAGAMTVERI